MNAREHMARVRLCGCVICEKRLGIRGAPAEVHHVGEASERNDWAVVPLCTEHHRGATGVHGLRRRAFRTVWKVSDIELLAWTNEALSKL